VLGRFRTDQSAAAGDQNFHPFESILLHVGRKSVNAVEFPRTASLKWAEIGDERARSLIRRVPAVERFFNCSETSFAQSSRRPDDFERHARGAEGTFGGRP
jgi:hypothetical protein